MARRIDHDVAAWAEAAFAEIAGGKPVPAEVLTRLKGLPALLRASGVPATLAFMGAKSGEGELGRAYGVVRSKLVKQLVDELGWQDEPADLYTVLAALPAADRSRAYLRLEMFAGWLRRLAEAEENSQQDKQPVQGAGTGDG